MSKFSDFIHFIESRVRWVKKFIGHDVWHLDTTAISAKKAGLVRTIKVVLLTLKTFAERAIGFQSVALSYFCAMAFVPFIAVAFAVTNGFGLEAKLKDLLYSLDVGPGLVDLLVNSSETIIDSATNGIFGLVSALMFVWLIIWMMMRVEKVFNNVWGVKSSNRSFFKSFGIDIVIMILAPFVVLILYSGTIIYSHILDLIPNWIGVSDSISSFVGWVIACAVTVMIFSAMYKFIPSAKVRYKFALQAAIIAGIAFTVLQYLYLETQVMVMRLNAVYGTIAAIPLFMIWLRFGWLIILYGAQASNSFQIVDGIDNEQEIEKKIRETKPLEEL